jgi:hypothetical protein
MLARLEVLNRQDVLVIEVQISSTNTGRIDAHNEETRTMTCVQMTKAAMGAHVM